MYMDELVPRLQYIVELLFFLFFMAHLYVHPQNILGG
jgi:hypothetical protein